MNALFFFFSGQDGIAGEERTRALVGRVEKARYEWVLGVVLLAGVSWQCPQQQQRQLTRPGGGIFSFWLPSILPSSHRRPLLHTWARPRFPLLLLASSGKLTNIRLPWELGGTAVAGERWTTRENERWDTNGLPRPFPLGVRKGDAPPDGSPSPAARRWWGGPFSLAVKL